MLHYITFHILHITYYIKDLINTIYLQNYIYIVSLSIYLLTCTLGCCHVSAAIGHVAVSVGNPLQGCGFIAFESECIWNRDEWTIS